MNPYNNNNNSFEVKGFSLFTLYVFLTGRDVLNLTMVFHGHYQRLRFPFIASVHFYAKDDKWKSGTSQ